MNPDAEGLRVPDVTFTVDPERVARFRGLFDASPRGGVPPTFATAAEFAVFPTIVSDPRVGLDFPRVVHASQEYRYARPLVLGERLTVRARVESIRAKGDTGFLTIVTELVAGDGVVAATCTSTMVERGV